MNKMALSEIVQQYQPLAGMQAQEVSAFIPVQKVESAEASLPAQKQEEQEIQDVVLISDKANKISDAEKKGDFALVDKMLAKKDENSASFGNMAPAYSSKLLGQKASEQSSVATMPSAQTETQVEEQSNVVAFPSEKRAEQNEGTTQSEETTSSEENAPVTNQVSEAELSSQEKQVLAELKATDAEVRAHEQAHIAAAGSGVSASGANYEYEKGPDGKKYAVAGEVNINYSYGSDHQENIQIAQTVKKAAYAPANPSAQDKSVARSADQVISEETKALRQEKMEAREEEKAQEAEDDAVKQESAQVTDSSADFKTDALPTQDSNSTTSTKNLIDSPVNNITQNSDNEVGVMVHSSDVPFRDILKQEQKDEASLIETYSKKKTVISNQQEDNKDEVIKDFINKDFDAKVDREVQHKNNPTYVDFLNLPVSLA